MSRPTGFLSRRIPKVSEMSPRSTFLHKLSYKSKVTFSDPRIMKKHCRNLGKSPIEPCERGTEAASRGSFRSEGRVMKSTKPTWKIRALSAFVLERLPENIQHSLRPLFISTHHNTFLLCLYRDRSVYTEMRSRRKSRVNGPVPLRIRL